MSIIANYNYVWGNGLTGTQSYSGCFAGAKDISSDPQFIGVEEHHSGSSSPCINAGLNNPPHYKLPSTGRRGRIKYRLW
ncbi:MAG: hypothetical protein ABIF11_08155 [Nitrospirota bacterium]